MIQFKEFTLSNGLRVIVHTDKTTPLAVLNVIYDVGSRDEHPDKTGFAHLFEHLMFGGSENIPDYDGALQAVGGENNAFTSPDVTNYYISLPAVNIETAFWLESDRMLALSFDPEVLEVQQKVVIEEFNQRYLNQPYGDAMLHLRPLTYKHHSYQWATIGKEVSHIENATMDDVKSFFFSHYAPNNAVLVLAGNIELETAKELSEKYFGSIPKRDIQVRNLEVEPENTEARRAEVEMPVPLDAIYRSYLTVDRLHPDFFAVEMLAEILGQGESSRLFQTLVKEQKLFNNLSAYHMTSTDKGMIVVNGKLNAGVSLEEAEAALDAEIAKLANEGITEQELQKTKNRQEAVVEFTNVEVLNRAINLAMCALLGDANLVNTDPEKISLVTLAQMNEVAAHIFAPHKANTLMYKSIKEA